MSKRTWKPAAKAKRTSRSKNAAAQKRALKAFAAAINQRFQKEGEE